MGSIPDIQPDEVELLACGTAITVAFGKKGETVGRLTLYPSLANFGIVTEFSRESRKGGVWTVLLLLFRQLDDPQQYLVVTRAL